MKRFISIFAVSFLLGGCVASSQPVGLNDNPAESAEQLIERYNTNAGKLDRVWSTTSTFLRWRDPDSGKMRREVGDGHFIFRQPRDLVLTVGKLGNVMLWTGGNTQKSWLFDLQEDDGIAYVGSYDQATRPFPGLPGLSGFPGAVHPDEIPGLLGMRPIDPAIAQTMWHDNDLLVDLPDRHIRLLLDGRNGLVKRVDLTDADGYSAIICELVGHKLVRQKDVDRSDWPVFPAEASVRVVGEEGGMVLKLANLTSEAKKFRDRAFDFDALLKMHKPKRVIDLDTEPQTPVQ